MKILSSALVKKSLSSHSWLGLFCGGLVYLVCLTGTLVVFSDEFRRWEQPDIDENPSYQSDLIENAINEFILSDKLKSQPLTVVLPSPTLPRTILYAGESPGVFYGDRAWLIDDNGLISTPIEQEWTGMLQYLHYYLHLPITYGMVVVSVVGTMLIALIVSGFFAHPLIFRDAFRLRLTGFWRLRYTGFRRLEQADIHNRLSVWGAPFHLMIAITGAYFGLAAAIFPVIADAFHAGDSPAVEGSVFGKTPELENQTRPVAVAAALESIKSIAPEATPFRIAVNHVGGPGQYLSIAATHPQRLVYEDIYLFDSSGTYLFSQNLSDGATGRQVVLSAYRLHFGYFGGFPVRIIYGILGLTLTIISVTGGNVWLARRKTRDYLNCLWAGLVWGPPTALALTAITQVIFGIPSKGIFWGVLISAIFLCLWLRDQRKGEQLLQGACALSLGALVAAHLLIFGADALRSAAGAMNLAILSTGAIMGMLALKKDPTLVSEEITSQTFVSEKITSQT